MKHVFLADGIERETFEVFGGKEQYQDARREWLEFVFPQEGNTVEGLEAALSAEHCAALTLVDPASGEQYTHEGYVLRGPARVYADENGIWKIAVRRYQRTDMEREVAELRETVAGLVAMRAEATA